MRKFFSIVCLSALLISPLIISSCKKEVSLPKENAIVVWHWMTDRDEAFQELAKQYKALTGVDVQFQLYAPSENYAQKIRVGGQTDTLPEIFGILGEPRDFASYVEAGHIENLTAALGEGAGSWKSWFYPEALESTYFKPENQFHVPAGFYGIPIDVATIPFIYNKKLFKKAGLDPEKPPKTWAEFLEAGKKLKASGVTGFVSGWGETWCIYSLVTDWAYNVMGEIKVMATFKGEVPYTDPQWLEVLQAFDQLGKAGFVDPSLASLGFKSAETAFTQERSAITFNGSWSVNVFAGMNPNLDYGVFAPPSLNPKNPVPVWGGAGSVFCVNAKSPNKDKAIAFLKWISEKKQAEALVKMTRNLPAVKDLGEGISPVLAGFGALMNHSIHPNRFTVTEDPVIQEILTKGIQSILIGEKTPQNVAEEVQAAKKRSIGK